MEVRELQHPDQQDWFEMRCLLWPGHDDDHVQETINHLAGDSRFVEQAFVAETDEGDVVGFIELKFRSYAEGSNEQSVPYVEGWFVRENWRNKGVGRALIKRAEQWAVEQGYHELASDAELENTSSIAAHQALGFQEVDRTVCFIKKL